MPSPPGWVPVVLFVLLAGFFLEKAVRPGARRSWIWGRGGGSVRLSRTSYAVCGVAFLAVAGVIAYADRVPAALIGLLVASFLGVLAAGFRDDRAHRRRSSTSRAAPDV